MITELLGNDERRKRQWLAQAHNLLFAPVLGSEEQALQSAEFLAKERLPVPVFTRQSLQRAADDSAASLMGAVIGHESLAVQSLLDPAFIEDWKQQLQDELGNHQRKLSVIEQELTLYHPESTSFLLAKSALAAVDQQAEEELPQLQATLENNQGRLHQLEDLLAPENRQIIRSSERFLDLGGEPALEELTDQLKQLDQQLEKNSQQLSHLDGQLTGEQRLVLDQAEHFLNQGGSGKLAELRDEIDLLQLNHQQFTEQHDECRDILESLNKQIDECQSQVEKVYQPGEKDRLIALDSFLQDGGPAFMDEADSKRASLESQQTLAQQRASLKFDRIRAYLNARDNQDGTAALKKRIAEIKNLLSTSRKEQEGKDSEIHLIRERQPQQLKAIHQVDETADRWLKQLCYFSPAMLAELPEPDLERLETMPLFEKAEQYREACQAETGDIEQVSELSMMLSEQLEQENTRELSNELKRQDKVHDELEDGFREMLQRIQEHERQLFNSTEQSRLKGLSEADSNALKELNNMISTLDEQITYNTNVLNDLQESMSGLEDKLNERLSSIIMHSVDNLKILRSVAKQSSGDNAYFLIDADIVSEDGIRSLVRSLLAEIEEHQRQIRSRKAQNLPVGSEEKQVRDLQKNLRSQIYRQLFTNIRIRLKHDAIRPHGNPFSLNEDMSEGQREAISLMWLVKLSEFAIERELKSVPSQYRRKERKSSESVIILDGLFSKLSHKKLIEDSLESLRNTRGRFQMVGLIHNPNYENDPGIFPTYLVGNVIGGLQGQGGHVTVKEGMKVSPASVGRGMGEASLFHLHVDHEQAES